MQMNRLCASVSCPHSQGQQPVLPGVQVIIMHRSIFESLMRTLKGHLLYQAEYLSRLLVKPPAGRSEADVLKLASYLTSLQRFQEVPQPQLVQLAKEVTYAELTAGTLVCKQGHPLAIASCFTVADYLTSGFAACSCQQLHTHAAVLN